MLKLRKTQQTERRISLERVIVGEVSFLRVTPLFYQSLSFYGKILTTPFLENFENSNPLFMTGASKGNNFLLKIETPFFVEVEMLN